MAKMTETKKAWQRADRLKKTGVSTPALEKYKADLKAVNQSGMSRKEKNAAKQKIAAAFNKSELSTKKGIEAAFKKEQIAPETRKKIEAGGVKEKARFVKAKKLMKTELEAKAHGLYGGDINSFIEELKAEGKAQSRTAMRRALDKYLTELTAASLDPGRNLDLTDPDAVSRFKTDYLRRHYKIYADR